MLCVRRMLMLTARFIFGRRDRLRQTRPEVEDVRFFAALLLALCGAYSLIYFVVTAQRALSGPIGDFFGLWSCAKFLFDHPAAAIYDPATLKTAQVALGMDPSISYPFPYPPSFLLALWPFGLLPWLPAYFVLIGLTLCLFIWATTGRRWRSWLPLAALLAPATTITIIAGQAGLLAGALIAGGFRLAARRPILAGVLLGLLTYKPQVGVLVPVALVAAQLWRTVGAAIATLLALILVSTIAFGWEVWPAWIAGMLTYSNQFAAESGAILHLMPTVFAALLRLDVPPQAAQLIQAIVAVIAAAAVWDCFRRGPTPLAAAALMTATFLATPHAFVYDMPMVATAVLWTLAESQRTEQPLTVGERIVLVLAFAAPITLPPTEIRFPIAVLSLMLLLGLILRRCRRLYPVVPSSGRPSWLSFRAAESP